MSTKDTDTTDKVNKPIWDMQISTIKAHLDAIPYWLYQQDSRYAALFEHGYFVSKDKLVVSSPTMARQIIAQTLPLYSFEDPSPIAEPSDAQRAKLAAMPEWALGAGGTTAHLPVPAPPHLPPPIPLSAVQEQRFSPNLTVLQTLDESAADFFTKPLAPRKFVPLRNLIMNFEHD